MELEEKIINQVVMLKKVLLAVAVICFLSGGAFELYTMIAEGWTAEELIEKSLSSEKPDTKPQRVQNSNVKMNVIPENPFKSNKELATRAAEKNTVTSEIKTETEVEISAPIVLPQIPKQTVQAQSVKIPSAVVEERKIVNPVTMETQESKPEDNVQGIITTNGGKNVAIMSDGSILSEGERYLDGRIAYIGGDGIEIDNGKKIKFKE